MFALFNGPADYCETTMLLRRYGAIVLTDLAFGRCEPEELDLSRHNPIKQVLTNLTFDLAGIKNKLGAPIGAVVMGVAKDEGRRWLGRVQGWKEWETLYCLHVSPILANGREELKNAFSFLN